MTKQPTKSEERNGDGEESEMVDHDFQLRQIHGGSRASTARKDGRRRLCGSVVVARALTPTNSNPSGHPELRSANLFVYLSSFTSRRLRLKTSPEIVLPGASEPCCAKRRESLSPAFFCWQP